MVMIYNPTTTKQQDVVTLRFLSREKNEQVSSVAAAIDF